jgi:hypothetical protein
MSLYCPFCPFLALDNLLKQRPAFGDKDKAKLSCLQKSNVKTNFRIKTADL